MTETRVSAFVRERLGAILKCPDGWGSPFAVELQVLLLVELFHTLHDRDEQHVEHTVRRWQRHTYEKTNISGPQPFSEKLKLEHRASERFVDVLRSFLAAEAISVEET